MSSKRSIFELSSTIGKAHNLNFEIQISVIHVLANLSRRKLGHFLIDMKLSKMNTCMSLHRENISNREDKFLHFYVLV